MYIIIIPRQMLYTCFIVVETWADRGGSVRSMSVDVLEPAK